RGDFTKAIPEQKLAIQYCTERRHLNLPVFQSLYHLYSTELENAGEYTRAIAEYRVTDIGHYDPEWKFANLIDSSLLSDAFQYVSLVRYGHIFFRWYLAENNSEYLKNAEQLALLARELYYKAAVTLEENALMTFAEERNTVLELLCQIYAEKYLRYHDADAFYKFHTYAEENRGAIFWKDVKSEWKFDSTLIRLLLVEQRLIAKDKQLRSVNHVDPDVLQNNIESLQKINDTIQKKYPVYYRQALNNQTPGIETIQDTLSNGNSSLIAFNFIDDKLYVEMIQTCAIDLFEVNITQERRNQLDTLITWMSTRNSVQANKYSSLAYSVWNWLIPDRIKEDTTFHWVIIPDGYVHKLNLEALVTEISEDDENFGSLKYLILKKEISYSPLIKSWMLHTPDSPLHDDNVVGFAWSDKKTVSSLNHTGLPELPGTISEMKNLRSGYPGAMIFDGKNATKENFIKSYCNSTTKLIELAVHGKASSYKRDDLMLYFRSHDGMVDTLFSYELIPLISGVETVILSACETGKGRILQGEGNYNLARYFLANGANSVITSLWKLDDKSFHLMSPIKMDTEKKSNFTLALRWDKLKLLKSGSKNNSPFYWAGIEIQS
ncbi:MAG: CHAT domain-containing protein, partial [Saprospiraceae bacterium]